MLKPISTFSSTTISKKRLYNDFIRDRPAGEFPLLSSVAASRPLHKLGHDIDPELHGKDRRTPGRQSCDTTASRVPASCQRRIRCRPVGRYAPVSSAALSGEAVIPARLTLIPPQRGHLGISQWLAMSFAAIKKHRESLQWALPRWMVGLHGLAELPRFHPHTLYFLVPFGF